MIIVFENVLESLGPISNRNASQDDAMSGKDFFLMKVYFESDVNVMTMLAINGHLTTSVAVVPVSCYNPLFNTPPCFLEV